MPIFHVYLNRKKLTSAGVGDTGVLNADVCWVRRTALAARGRATEELTLTVGGLITPKDQHVRWVEQTVQVGDEIRIKIGADGPIDRPRSRKVVDFKQDLQAQKRYVKRMAKRLGWKIVTKSKPA